MRNFIIVLILALFMVVLPVAPISGKVYGEARYYVTQDGSGEKDGSSWENSAGDLRGLMDSIDGEADIWVASGTYSPGVESDDSFVLKKGIRVYGGFAGTEAKIDERCVKENVTVLSGGKVLRMVPVVTAEGASSSDDTCLDGFTVTGGFSANNGSGIYVDIGGSPLINQCIFEDNTAYEYGAGMYNYYSSPLILNCVFSGNQSLNNGGGGIYNHYSSPVIENCSFISNKSGGHGGGMLSYGGIFKVLNSTFSGNKSSLRGGGMSSYASTLEVRGCVFSENTGQEFGGGMHNESTLSDISNCVFSNNKVTPGNGGGMANVDSSAKITECKFFENTADYYGGGVINFEADVQISDCVFTGNKAIRFNGGGLANWLTSTTINNSRFSGNTAVAGGGIYNHKSSSVMENNVFTGNKAKNSNDVADEESETTLK